MKNTAYALLLLVIAGLTTACDTDGPAEEAGESIDNAMEDVREAGEEAADEVEDAVDEVTPEA